MLGVTVGYRVQWQHPAGCWFTGELWPDRATAEYIAQMLRDSGWCLNIQIVPWRNAHGRVFPEP